MGRVTSAAFVGPSGSVMDVDTLDDLAGPRRREPHQA
jgi:hypothetical protein